MINIILNKEKELKSILQDFFFKGYHRNSKPEFRNFYDEEVFQVACQIYKRGFTQNQQNFALNGNSLDINFVEKKQIIDILNKKASSKIFYIIDANFYKKYLNLVSAKKIFLYEASETNKNLESMTQILREISSDCEEIIAIGGGITLDISGFIAGICKLPITYLATSLLATIDAAVGGKTGVNFTPFGKNQIGLFYNAKEFYCVPEFFQTLPQIEIISGMCEALKHSWLYGSFDEDLPIFNDICQGEYNFINSIQFFLKHISYKMNIVNQDPFENSVIRSSLNFGHTLAHIIEALCEEDRIKRIPHGIAVAHGMYFLIQNKYVENKSIKFINFLTQIIYLYPIVKYKGIYASEIEKYLKHDKKNINSFQCVLSLPSYACFSLNEVRNKNQNILKIFNSMDFSILASQYLNSF
ncbi:3-dehydroquinate synthase family protein [Fluviispira multicolorata]|nr:3-dehydroquinate synthase [Fluviispira multicolorata]